MKPYSIYRLGHFYFICNAFNRVVYIKRSHNDEWVICKGQFKGSQITKWPNAEKMCGLDAKELLVELL